MTREIQISSTLKQPIGQLDAIDPLDILPLTGGMGAEIRGVDLSRHVDDRTFRAVNQVLLDHGVIFFRDLVGPQRQREIDS